ncbi:MAG: ribonuclease Z [Clostridia bacterium]|nr:ribonuclease Z [Clostridia bacterium]
MILIVAVDDLGGVAFNHRRQSKDRVLRERVLALCRGTKLWVTPYTASQFEEGEPCVCVTDNPLSQAGVSEYVWAEDLSLQGAKGVEKVIVFRWNRTYPHDRVMDFPLGEYRLLSSEEFEGFSHPKITQEIYVLR